MFRHGIFINLFKLAKKKSIKIANFFNNKDILNLESFDDERVSQLISHSSNQVNEWKKLAEEERIRIQNNFYQRLNTEESILNLSSIASACTGKQIKEAESQMRVSLKILDYNLKYTYQTKQFFGKNFYTFEPYDNIISIFDHRNPILCTFRYLGLALKSKNSLLLRPDACVIPIAKKIEQVWKETTKIELINCLPDPYDPKQIKSPILNILKQTQGFLSFSGRIQKGFQFHSYMASTSEVFRQNQYLLTSSDSAYVMKDLSLEQLSKVSKIIARGSFSNAGSSFNSIKRIYVDRQVADSFIKLLIQEASSYKLEEGSISTIKDQAVNIGSLAPIFLQHEYHQNLQKINKIKNQQKQQFTLLFGGEGKTLKMEHKDINYILPTIFKVNCDFPNYNYQNQELISPVCFISIVDSPQDCIQKINSSIYGIACSLFTSNNCLERIEKMGKKLDVGTVNVNTWQVTDGITYSGRKRSGKGFSFSPLSFNNAVRSKAISYGQ